MAFHLRRYSLISFELIRHNPISPFPFLFLCYKTRFIFVNERKKGRPSCSPPFLCFLTAFGYFIICLFSAVCTLS
ncbi:hypothetical protein HMPREF0373_01947 [Eubacterium ramulus ATCC 29099]|uniref:Uncharacterized protein n=1 Tax=Eubacterium ramulus ATCC 29099 TaxID=1256908 RepID=U2PQ14_EUBRA|nr:hypothetical protein HMPREF0373_01947 [Eubacterium ramulus ATCC 29099]